MADATFTVQGNDAVAMSHCVLEPEVDSCPIRMSPTRSPQLISAPSEAPVWQTSLQSSFYRTQSLIPKGHGLPDKQVIFQHMLEYVFVSVRSFTQTAEF